MSEKMQITLTGRPPIRIAVDAWPIIASAHEKDWDNQYESQANRTWKWWVNVRQHADGRAIVYASYSYCSCYQGDRGHSIKNGRLLAANDDICTAIQTVCDDMAATPVDDDHSARWAQLAADCIADLPAQELE